MPRASILLLLSCASPCGDGAPAPARPAGEPRVVVLVVDGARLDETFGAGESDVAGQPSSAILPTIHEELLPQGALVLPGHATGVTLTAPGHCDLLTGRRQDLANYPVGESPGAYLPLLPTLFEAVRAAGGDPADVALVSNTELIAPLQDSLYPGSPGGAAYHEISFAGEPTASDAATLDKIRSILKNDQPRLLVANLHDADRGGHLGEADGYLGPLESLDQAIPDLWAWLQKQRAYADNTLLVVVADHGRHRTDDGESWFHHGDQCEGCREVPLLLLGPGVRAGAVLDTPATLEDVGQTIAAFLGVDLPYGTGVVLADAFEDPPASAGGAGQVRPARAGGLTAAEERRGDAARRSRIWLGEDAFDADFLAEDPRLAAGGGAAVACWRELPGPADRWLGRCLRRTDGAWEDLALPLDSVSPLWAPALAIDDAGALWLAMVDNVNGATTSENHPASVRLLTWADGAWQADLPAIEGVPYPSHPALLLDPEPVVAFVTAEDDHTARRTRRVEIHRLEGGAWTQQASLRPGEEVDADRLESPALGWADGQPRLAFLSFRASGEAGVWMSGWDADSAAWTTPVAIDSGPILGHVSPAFAPDGALWWARLTAAGTAEICRYDGAVACEDTGRGYIDGLAADEAGAVAALRDAASAWELVEIEVPR